MKNKLIFCLVLLTTSLAWGQQKITWGDLAQVTFTEKYFSDYGDYFLYPEFKKSLRDLEGKEVTITGYFLNIVPQEEIYMLSQNPAAACFFCGVGGPETVIELQFDKKPPFKNDGIVTITGILKLNADDVEHFNFILTGARGKKAD